MTIVMSRQTLAKILTGLFLSASVLVAVAPISADAAPMSKCRNNPENFKVFRGKCMSDKRIEILKERRGGEHGPNHQ